MPYKPSGFIGGAKRSLQFNGTYTVSRGDK